MAQLAGTSDTYLVSSGGGIREDLEDTIWELFPEDTWCLSNFDKVEATASYHEWLGDELASASLNAVVEGDDASFADIDPPGRYGNQCQISRKTFMISGTLEKVKKAGRKSEVAREAMKKMKELKRDMEVALTNHQEASAGGGTTARQLGGMEVWIGGTTINAATGTGANAVRATIASAGETTVPLTSGAPTTAITEGATVGPLSELALKCALQGAWEDGGDPRVILAHAQNKAYIDGFTGVATRFVDVGRSAEASIIGAANLYVSDFGRHQVILHRYCRARTVMAIDPDYWAVAFLRRPFREELAKTGDATKHQILTEYTLVARNWRANGKVVAVGEDS